MFLGLPDKVALLLIKKPGEWDQCEAGMLWSQSPLLPDDGWSSSQTLNQVYVHALGKMD